MVLRITPRASAFSVKSIHVTQKIRSNLRHAIHYPFSNPQSACFRQERRRFRTSTALSSSYPPDFSSYPYDVITSSKSQTVKKIQALLTKRKKRMDLGQTVVEGPRMVFDLLNNPKTTSLIRQVVVSLPEYDDRDDYRSNLNEALHATKNDDDKKDLLIQLATPEVFRSCSDTMTPQGIVAIVDIPSYEEVGDETVGVNTALHLVLDGVSDPGNLGTLLRSSLAVGVKSVILLPGCCDVWNPKAVRSGMGASFQIPICACDSWDDGLATLNELGVRSVYAATMIEEENGDGNYGNEALSNNAASPKSSVPYYQVDWVNENAALVVGSEGNGLSEQVRRALMVDVDGNEGDTPILKATHIPMEAGIESLNAAVCGSVILFEYSRQRALFKES
ncbi:MAG: hypothetical protein SGILL_000664 [Bacillariaceae sp.]